MLREHEHAVLTTDLPEYGLKAGDVGVVVMVHAGGRGYELEIFTVDGRTLDVVTVTAEQVRALQGDEVMHARPIR